MTPDGLSDRVERLRDARVLVEVGEIDEAELITAALLEAAPEDLTALSLLAKIQHMKGDLSQAIACWARIHARSPHSESTLMHLGALLHLAKSPEQAASDLLVLGQLQGARAPLLDLELAQAFRCFLSGGALEARARCRDLARRYGASSRESFKLAAMADAWIAEMCGDLEAACDVLESIGREHGLWGDLDRMMALVRLYERIGRRETLERAVHICRQVARCFEKMSIHGHLAWLYGQLGQAADERESAERLREAFTRRMHRASLEDVVAVAVRRYLPLPTLACLPLGPVDPAAFREAPPRARAIVAALGGRFAEARDRLRVFSHDDAGTQGELLDRKYLADLAALEGDVDAAARLHLEVWRRDPDDIAALGWLLDDPRRAPMSALAVLGGAAEPGRRAREAMEAAIRRQPFRAPLWRWLSALHEIAGQPAQARRCADRAAALEVAAQRAARPVGRALAAGVYHFVGKAKGLIHEVWAGREGAVAGRGGWLPDDQILGTLTAEMKIGVRNTFVAVREYARAKFPQLTQDIGSWSYTFKVTKEDEPSGGLSAGLPTALAFLSVFLQRPLPQDVASSGVLVTDAHNVLSVRRVGEAEYKVKGAYNRNLRHLVLPEGNRAELASSMQVPRAISHEMVRYATNLDDALRIVFGEDVFSRDGSGPLLGPAPGVVPYFSGRLAAIR